MTELTDAEFIAEKLFGWKAEKRTRGCKCTRWTLEDPLDVAIVYDDGFTSGSDYWPQLHDWNHIRRIEDALSEKGLLERYIYALLSVPYCDRKTQPGAMTLIMCDWMHIKQATQAQCVEACVKVLREVQG